VGHFADSPWPILPHLEASAICDWMVTSMKTIKANSPRQELEWALCELRRCCEEAAAAIHAEEAAEERVRKAREEVNKAKVCDQCGLTPKLAMDAHLVLCVRKSAEE